MLLLLSSSSCAAADSGTAASAGWNCTTISPHAETAASNPCFRASVTRENLVTLEWRAATSDNRIYIYDDIGPNFDDIGEQPARCDDRPDGICTTSFRVERGGDYRWVLAAHSQRPRHTAERGGRRVHVPASLVVPSPYPLVEITGGGFADMLAPVNRRLGWQVDPRNRWGDGGTDQAWIEVKVPGSTQWSETRYERTGPGAGIDVPAASLSEQGSCRYYFRDCHYPEGQQTKFCSEPVSGGFRVCADRFIGPNPLHAESGRDLDIEFTDLSGNVRVLSSDTLFLDNPVPGVHVTTGTTLTIDAKLLTPGTHRINLASCLLHEGICSDRIEADRVERAGSILKGEEGLYHEGAVLAVVESSDGGPAQWITSPATGIVRFYDTQREHPVDARDRVAYLENLPAKVLEIAIDSPVQWELDRPYSMDFSAGRAFAVRGGGAPLDITYDASGGIWLINEFSTSIEHISPGGEVASYTVPLLRRRATDAAPARIARPFGTGFGSHRGRPTAITSLGERALAIDDTIWFTQGGGSLWRSVLAAPNHSRIIAFAWRGDDLLTTLHDDRFCIYNVPASDPGGFTNSQVIGLDKAGGRIWIAESRGLWNQRPSVLSSFLPDPANCANLLDFDNPEAISQQRLQYCGPGRTPEQDGCMEKRVLEAAPEGFKAAHLAAEPDGGAIWFTDAHGHALGRMELDASGKEEYFALPDKHDDFFYGNILGFGGYTWSIAVDSEAVYIGEYLTQHIIRFDKRSRSFDEITVPHAIHQSNLHSLAIDHASGRLWFTLGTKTRVPLNGKHSTIGYIDLKSWSDYLKDPSGPGRVHGVTYSGLGDLKAGIAYREQPHGLTGIDVQQSSGRVAIASMFRREVIELVPHGAFRPPAAQ